MFSFLETFWLRNGRKYGIWESTTDTCQARHCRRQGICRFYNLVVVMAGALCDTGNIREYAANSERIARQLGLHWMTVLIYAAAQPRSSEWLGSEGLAVGANGASGGKEHAD